MDATKKRVAIVGAGASGLTACKHALAKGFRPVVFEAAGDGVGGVWRRTLASTRLQTPAFAYRFSDFPWPADVSGAEVFPRHDQVVEYLAAYARRHGVTECVRFGCKVLAAEYAGVPDEEAAAWERWSGNGEAFGDGSGEWLLTVQHPGSEATQIHRVDFLILCTGRFSGVAHTPTFPPNRGPEVFHGQVLHSMDYSNMGHAAADELIRGKRVAVVGSGKSAFDTVAECAAANEMAAVEAGRDLLQDADPDGEARDGAGGELRGINVGLPARSPPRQVLRQGGGRQHPDQEGKIFQLLHGRLGARRRRHRRARRRRRRRARHRLPWRPEAHGHVRLGDVQAADSSSSSVQAVRAPADPADGGDRVHREPDEHLHLRDDGQVGGAPPRRRVPAAERRADGGERGGVGRTPGDEEARRGRRRQAVPRRR
ncbi:putative flavin-containing monooxygenase 2 isoform X2 [Oryza sativa Japonica Group]|uniref:putative flavin-containing monooxygenase 2 isoform X2 n=1 Tax=Oryza sativa subsp. japonica TaxID=39947 RepID=UPI000E1BD42B|nr:putative flavin-containing monooxygenase 2 isoform X2 [Oryza sativa Japonica Group]